MTITESDVVGGMRTPTTKQKTREYYMEKYKSLNSESKIVKKSDKVYGFDNQDKINQLKKEYESTLNQDQQLAILLFEIDDNNNHLKQDWYFETNGREGIFHDFENGFFHREFLAKARNIMKSAKGIPYETIVNIIKAEHTKPNYID